MAELDLRTDVPPFADNGVGGLMMRGANAYREEYVLTTDGDDHQPTEFEQWLLEDFVAGLMSDERFFGPVRALLSRLEQHSPVSDGWRLVPVEPTEEMINAHCRDYVDVVAQSTPELTMRVRRARAKIAYRAMLSASPPPPGGRGRDEGDGGSVAGCAGAQSALPAYLNPEATPLEGGE